MTTAFAADSARPDRRPAEHALAETPQWNRILFAALLVLLVWIPIPIASAPQGPMSLLALMTWSLVAVWLAAASLTGHVGHLKRLAQASGWLLLLAGLPLIMLGQLLHGVHGWPVLDTVDDFRTRVGLMQSLLYLGLAVLVLLCVHTQQRALAVLAAVLIAGFLQAVLAVALHTLRTESTFLFFTFEHGGRLLGTFPNTDHLAGYMELCLSAGLGVMLAQFGDSKQKGESTASWQQRSTGVLSFILSTKMLVRMSLVVLVVALVMTHSRMGNGAFFIAMFFVGGVVAIASKQLRKPALWLVASMAVIDLIVIGQWVGLSKVVDRVQDTVSATRADVAEARGFTAVGPASTDESLLDRLQAPRLALVLVEQRPWFGHGARTFEVAFAAAKPPALAAHRWDMAHNDYVQTAAELGWTGLALFVGIGLATLWRAARLLPDSQPRISRGIGAAGLMALCCLGLHSMVDFNLQTAGNAATLVVILAVVWATPRRAASSSRSKTGTARAAAQVDHRASA